MKSDKYQKIILTIIAICLIVLVLDKVELIQKATAGPVNNSNYALVPLNDDGSINVRLISSEEVMEVNIREVGGDLIRKAIPIQPDNNVLDINISEVGGWRVNSRVPVEN